MLLVSLALAAPFVRTESTFGGAFPLFVQAVAPDGAWVVGCEARADSDKNGEIAVYSGYHGDTYGDALAPYLYSAANPTGEPIDRLLGHADGGRHVAFVRAGRVFVRDMRSGTERDFGVAPADVANRFALAPDGSAVAELFDDRVVVRPLGDGAARTVVITGGKPWRVELFTGGWLVVGMIEKDTDGDGVLTAPTARSTLYTGVCRGTVMSFSTYGHNGDTSTWRAWRGAGLAEEPRTLVGVGEGSLVVREADGALTWAGGDGRDTALAPAACKGQVAVAWEPAMAAVVTCADGAAVLYDRQGTLPLGKGEIDPLTGRVHQRLALLPEYRVLDLATRAIWPRAYAGEQGLYGDVLLEQLEDHSIHVRDLRSQTTRPLAAFTAKSVYATTFGRWSALNGNGSTVVDLASGTVVGELPSPPEAIRADGSALVPDTQDRGPLRWFSPPGVQPGDRDD